MKRPFTLLISIILVGSHLSFAQAYLAKYRHDTTVIVNDMARADRLESSKPDSAFSIYEQVLVQSRKAGFLDGVCLALSHEASILSDKGDYKQAIAKDSEALHYVTPSPRGINTQVNIYNNIGVAYGYTGDYEQTLKYLQQGLSVIEKHSAMMKPDAVSNVYINLSNVTLQLKKYEQSIYYLDRAEINAKENKDNQSIGKIFINKGVAYGNLHDLTKSEYYYQAAVQVAKEQNMPAIRCVALIDLGSIYLAKNNAKEALKYLKEGEAFEESINPYYRIGISKLIGKAYLQLGNNAGAGPYLLKALTNAEKLNIPVDLVDIHNDLATLYAKTGDYRKAYEHEQASYLLTDSLQNAEKVEQTSQLETRFRSAEKDNLIAQKELRILQQASYIKQKNIWLGSITAALVLVVALLLSLYRGKKQREKISLLNAMIEGEEMERNRIGRELHDGIGGMLAAANINLGTIQKKYQHVPEMHALDEIVEVLQNTASEVRKTAHNLIPDMLLERKLSGILQLFCDQVNAAGAPAVDLQLYGEIDTLDPRIVLPVYRIVQELIHNIVKHACATHAVVQVRLYAHKLNITVEDNGKGFDPHVQSKGQGLKNLNLRVDMLQGTVAVESAPGMGTVVYIEIDLSKNT